MTDGGTASDRCEAHLVDLRRKLVSICAESEGGHLGGSFSVLEMLAAIYLREESRPSLVLSKGHAALGLYGILNLFGTITDTELRSFCTSGSVFGTHTSSAVPGISVSTGSLGHGLSIAAGWALSPSMRNRPVYAVLGDGETQEGSVPEAARVCGHLRIRNLVALIDHNGGQQTGSVLDINSLTDPSAWWTSMGWRVVDVPNGNCLNSVLAALDDVRDADGPSAILCHTTKGHGAGELAGATASHFVALNPTKLERVLASMKETVMP